LTLDALRRSISDPQPPGDLGAPLQALWWARKGDWNRAHGLVQDDPGAEAAWVHAHLHRIEGDLDNARYWYRQARRSAETGPLEAEWETIAQALLREQPTNPG
jgi:hypothetical protein